jgi:peroxiredoxin
LPLALIGAGLLLLAALAWTWLSAADANALENPDSEGLSSVVPVAVDYPAPELSLQDLSGVPVSLEGYRGQVVLVNNWAIWCPPCKAEMPVLQAYYLDHRDRGFTIIGIEAGEPTDQVVDFVEDYGLSFPVWPDLEKAALKAFQNGGLPNSYVIDRDGQVRLAWTGAISREMLDAHVTPLLGDG